MAIVYDHKEYEKDIPKKYRDIMLPHVYFVSKGVGKYHPISANPFALEPIQAAMVLNVGWLTWRNQKRRQERENVETTDLSKTG